MEKKRVFNLMIVDKSGSMNSVKEQTLMGLNETIRTVKRSEETHPEMEQRITLITFESEEKRYVFDNVPAANVRPLTEDDYKPKGSTPLYDAIGMGISRLNGQVRPEDHVLVTIITDGEENSSFIYNRRKVRRLIKKLKEQNWTFTLIGADDLNVKDMADSMSIIDRMVFVNSAVGVAAMFDKERKARTRFYDKLSRNEDVKTNKYFENKSDVDIQDIIRCIQVVS